MKQYIFLIICLLSIGKIYSQNCTTNTSNCENGNAVKTNPTNPSNANCPSQRNNFDWRVQRTDFLPEDYIVYGPGTIYKEIQNPFTGPTGAPHAGTVTNQRASNYQPEDGWELLKVEFGIKGNVNINNDPNFLPNQPTNYTKPKLPYMILYNKYSGTMRFFGSLLDANSDYETLEIILTIPSKDAKYLPNNSNDNPIDYNENLKSTNLLSIQGESVQPLDQETDEASISIFIKFRNNEAEFFWFDLPVAYDPCICNNKVQLDVAFRFTQTAQIALNQVVENGIKNVSKSSSSGNADYARMVFGRILAAGVSGALAIKTGGAIVNYKAFIDLIDVVKDHPSRANNQTEKDNLNKLKNYLTCSEKMFSVVNGSFKDITGTDAKKQIAAGQKILDANTTFLSSLVKGCNTADNAATGTTNALDFSGTFTRSPMIGGSEIFLAMPGSNWSNINLLPKDYVSNNTIVPSYPTYNERLGTFALLKTPKIHAHILKETIIEDNSIPIIKATGRTVCNLKVTDDLIYCFNPKLNVDYGNTKIYCRIVLREIEDVEFVNGNNFKFETKHQSCSTILRNNFNLENKFFKKTPNSLYGLSSTFVDINQFKNMPLTFSLTTNNISNLSSIDSKIIANTFIQFKILLTSFDEVNNKPITAYHLFTYPLNIFMTEYLEPHLIDPNWDCAGYNDFINNTFIPGIQNTFTSSVPTMIFENKEYNSDVVFNMNQIFLYDGIVTIKAKLSSANGVKVKIYSTIGFELEVGAEISPDIELIVGLPLEVIPQPAQTYTQVASFCDDPNKYKASQFSSLAKAQEKLEYERRAEQEAIQKAKFNFRIHPNPSDGIFNISFIEAQEEPTNLNIIDISGKTVYTQVLEPRQINYNLQLTSLAAGVYFVNIIGSKNSSTQKIVIQK